MSDFWKRRLAQATPQAPAPQTAPAAGQAWWQQGIPQRPQPAPAPQVPQQPEQPTEYKPHQAKSAQVTDTMCPACYKDTLLPVPGQPTMRPRCTACGYPVEHSTSGMHVPTDPSVPVESARQVSTANNFSFGNVFAHIGDDGSVR